ncbi:terpene synthase family protein [Micromonospora sp. NPDC051296]|uniref:terpene synthase family protein n=1 Tax=Micromonospora sp. NPDC051296 TaxID=3155046 RepID=UPI003422FB89
MPPHPPASAFAQAAEQGRVCSLAAKGQRDLQERVATYRSLFPDPPVDAAMLSALALSTAFIAPWCSAADLRTANRASLWVTAEDWQIDSVAASMEAATAIAEACRSVAAGAEPASDDLLGRFLADIRDDLAALPAFRRLGQLWQDELQRMLDAELREWQWRAAREADPADLPAADDYLANAAGYGATWVNVSHWIATGAVDTEAQLTELVTASKAVEQVLRLVNDLASYDRDVKAGDLNILMLGVDRHEVRQQVTDRLDQCEKLLHSLERTCPQEAAYLRRELGFTTGFYHGTDFWGPR